MAAAALRDELDCSICLDTYTDPVMLRCGHNFCRDCIDQMLDTQDECGLYSCPECREEFVERPALMRNFTLSNIVRNFLHTESRPKAFAGIFCTYCIDSPVPAVKTCLLCEASLCDKHLKVHSKSPEHVLSDPSTSLENMKCPVHKKILEYYCTEDATCICVSCTLVGKHRGHQVESLDEASDNKKKKLRNVLQKLMTQRDETEKKISSMRERWIQAQEKASGEHVRVQTLFMDIRRRLDDLEKKILIEFCNQEEEVSHLFCFQIHQLEIKNDELSRKMRHIEELCNVTDPLIVLQEPDTGDLCDPEEGGGDEDTGGPDVDDLDVTVICDALHDIISGIKSGAYLGYPADILLDINTAGNNIHISKDLKSATRTQEVQNRPETAVRFQHPQVISRGTFTSGQHYWDVEGSSTGSWRVGMCYPSMDRKGDKSYIGNNNKSWSLKRRTWFNNECSVMHNKKEIRLLNNISCDKFRICLDYEAGRLSFYELCDSIRLLYTFNAIFTEPLHVALCVWDGSLKISDAK
ncbi:E3 ubiquitin/ISG15 ligase TRIM25-like [Engystomops pustulosus]|uniref:E3 ubiquitin/ISG15 ligase TRIM25-like n=1 Tax=Engystomops pustulosus TaxID=76066 RepID=UPI003AFB75B7